MNYAAYKELISGILQILPEQVRKSILYGSVARKTATEESDVDIAILVRGKLDPKKEDELSAFIAEMDLKYDKVFSVIDINVDEFNAWVNVLPFYNHVEREGVVLWKAA